MKRRTITPVDADCLLLTVPQVATLLGIGRNKAWELATSGQLRVIRIGRSVRVHRTDVEQFAEGLRFGSDGPEDAA